jgi:ribosomal protein S18 acetylase RimI-like enzyme
VAEFRAPRIEPLGERHDRSAFSCGVTPLDDYFRRQAGQDSRRSVARVYVALDDETKVVCGYYTLSAASVAWSGIPESIARKLPRYPVPVALIGRLAVDKRFQGRSLGKYLLFDGIHRALALGREIALFGVAVDAKDDTAAAFYRRYGFQPLSEHGRRLLLPLATLTHKS